MSDAPGPVQLSRSMKWQGAIIRAIGLTVIRVVYRIRKIHADRVPKTGGVLLLPNHVTFADAFFITAACPRPVRFVMDDAFMKWPAIAWFCRIFNTVTIRKDQPREALRITIDALKNGDVVCYFPEGQLSRNGALNELKRGVELIAKKAGVPLVPLWIDGAWGSVFSFERGKFFGKLPYRLPHRITAAFGNALDPNEMDLESLRIAMLKSAADAIERNFDEGSHFTVINGYQIGQVRSLNWRTAFAMLQDDPLEHIFSEYSIQFGSLIDFQKSIDSDVRRWVGGEKLRNLIEASNWTGKIEFYDFSERALVPLDHPNVRHYPCLAIDGRVVSMSMPDPRLPHPIAEFQNGDKPGTYGLLLPGWYFENGKIRGPAAPEGLDLPAGTFPDAEGFIAAR